MVGNTGIGFLLEPDFLEGNQGDPLFSRMVLRLNHSYSVRMYHKTFDNFTSSVFQVVAIETTRKAAGYTRIFAAHIQNWKRPPATLNAVFEPRNE